MPVDLLEEVAAAPAEAEAVLAVPEAAPPQRTRRGRGRPPKVRTPAGEDEAGEPDKPAARPRSNTAASRKLADDLLDTTVSVASDLSVFAPTVSGVLIARAEVAVNGMMALAKGHPKVEASLRKVTQVSKVAELMSLGLLLVVAAAVDLGRVPADSPILEHLGYADIVRDEAGKVVKDEAGRVVKTRRTLKDIRDSMVKPEAAGEDPELAAMPAWSPQYPERSAGGMTFTPPMNWTG